MSDPAPRQLGPADPEIETALHLIRSSFADMDGRIDPPSSIHRLTAAGLAAQAAKGEVWALGAPLLASMVLTPWADWLYLGRLAVAPSARGRGHARRLVDHAMTRARRLGLRGVALQSRIELVEVHAAFLRMGFVRTGETAHPGFDRPTSVTFRRRSPG